jgi:hypothetical protein
MGWCPLCTWPTQLVETFIVLVHWNNSLHVDMSVHTDTLSWLRANQFLFLLLNAAFLDEKQQILILYSGMTVLRLEPMIYRTLKWACQQFNHRCSSSAIELSFITRYFHWIKVHSRMDIFLKLFSNRLCKKIKSYILTRNCIFFFTLLQSLFTVNIHRACSCKKR